MLVLEWSKIFPDAGVSIVLTPDGHWRSKWNKIQLPGAGVGKRIRIGSPTLV
jgi:hypothetical protein